MNTNGAPFGRMRWIKIALSKRMAKSGGSGYNGDMSDGSVNTRLGTIEGDIRTMWKAFLGLAVILSGAITTGYIKTNDKIEIVRVNISDLKTSIAVQDQKINQIMTNADRTEKKIDSIIQKLDELKPAKSR